MGGASRSDVLLFNVDGSVTASRDAGAASGYPGLDQCPTDQVEGLTVRRVVCGRPQVQVADVDAEVVLADMQDPCVSGVAVDLTPDRSGHVFLAPEVGVKPLRARAAGHDARRAASNTASNRGPRRASGGKRCSHVGSAPLSVQVASAQALRVSGPVAAVDVTRGALRHLGTYVSRGAAASSPTRVVAVAHPTSARGSFAPVDNARNLGGLRTQASRRASTTRPTCVVEVAHTPSALGSITFIYDAGYDSHAGNVSGGRE